MNRHLLSGCRIVNFSRNMIHRAVPQTRIGSTPSIIARCMSGAVNWHGTTIICVRKDGKVAMAGDGQVSAGPTVVKGNARKVRRLTDNILVGFAGSTADALTLLERLEKKLEEYPGQLTRACVELAKAWRTDKYLRRLEAVLLVADINGIYELTGNGDVLEPQIGVMGVGSGGNFAQAAALALYDQPNLSAEDIVRKAMKIAGDMCVYTNHNVLCELLPNPNPDSKAGGSGDNNNSSLNSTDSGGLPPSTKIVPKATESSTLETTTPGDTDGKPPASDSSEKPVPSKE